MKLGSDRQASDRLGGQPLLAALFLGAVLLSGVVPAAMPEHSGPVVDNAEILSAEAVQRLEILLRKHEGTTSNQVAVLTVPTLGPKAASDFAREVMTGWNLGGKATGMGVLLLVVPQDNKVHIEVGPGLDSILTEEAAETIVRDQILPALREEKDDAGLEGAVRALIGILEGRGAATPASVILSRSGKSWRNRGDGIVMKVLLIGFLTLFSAVVVLFQEPSRAIYRLMIPIWAICFLGILGLKLGLVFLGVCLVGFPVTRLMLLRTAWYQGVMEERKVTGCVTIAGISIGSRRR